MFLFLQGVFHFSLFMPRLFGYDYGNARKKKIEFSVMKSKKRGRVQQR